MSTVRPATRADLEPAGAALARAFDADPVFVSLWPEAARRARALRAMMGMPLGAALRGGHVEVLEREGGAIAGAAAWFPPGAYPLGPAEQLRALRRILAVALVAPRSMRRFKRLGENIDAAFPREPVWYLCVVGLAPEAQDQGHGAALLGPGLARVDADAGAAYLETATDRAARLYERLGFTTIEAEARLLPGGPPQRRMLRPASRNRPAA